MTPMTCAVRIVDPCIGVSKPAKQGTRVRRGGQESVFMNTSWGALLY